MIRMKQSDDIFHNIRLISTASLSDLLILLTFSWWLANETAGFSHHYSEKFGENNT